MQHLGAGTPPTRDCDPPKGMARHWDTPFTPPKKKKKGAVSLPASPWGHQHPQLWGRGLWGHRCPWGVSPYPPPFPPPPALYSPVNKVWGPSAAPCPPPSNPGTFLSYSCPGLYPGPNKHRRPVAVLPGTRRTQTPPGGTGGVGDVPRDLGAPPQKKRSTPDTWVQNWGPAAFLLQLRRWEPGKRVGGS